MQPDKLAPMFSSLLCDSIGITWGKLTLKARLTVNFHKHLQWKIYRMKTGGALLNTGLIRSIRYIIYMWSDHMLKSYLRMCHTNLSSCRWTVQRTRPTVRKWNSNRRQDLVAILHSFRCFTLVVISCCFTLFVVPYYQIYIDLFKMQRKARKDQKVPEPNAMEIFKDCHTSKKKGMTTPVKAAVVSP